VFRAGLWCLIITLPINIGLTYALVIPAGMRVAGAALAASLTNLLRPLILVGYAFFVDRATLQCWPSRKEIHSSWTQDWGSMCRLALSGTVMTLSEWLSFEILTFALTYLGNAPLAAQTFLSTTATFVWHIPFSISIAGSTRVGQLVGGGLTHSSALKIMKMYGSVFALNGLLNVALGVGVVAFMLRFLVNDPEVADIVLANLPFLGAFLFCDAIVLWPHSVVRGIGWQSIAAYTTLGSNYLYGVPLALFLELGSPGLGVTGLWVGIGSAIAVTCIIEVLVVWTRLRKEPDAYFEEYYDGETQPLIEP
jgi:MATE family multidrug resistance protein